MSTLTSLKLTNATKPTSMPVIQQKRNKLTTKIWEQIQLAEAQASGGTYASKRFKTITTADGDRKTVELEKRVRPWWFTNEEGKICVAVKYGSKAIHLAKDKTAVELGSKDELVNTLKVLKSAIELGELDQEIEKASGTIRARFKKLNLLKMSFERHFETECDTYELNTCMYRYQVYVKVKGSMVKTIIFADNDIHARLLAQYQYGINNVSISPQRIGN
jgi:hypothetical protein